MIWYINEKLLYPQAYAEIYESKPLMKLCKQFGDLFLLSQALKIANKNVKYFETLAFFDSLFLYATSALLSKKLHVKATTQLTS